MTHHAKTTIEMTDTKQYIKTIVGLRYGLREPVVGRWYAGMDYSAEPGEPPLGGELMKYLGEGVWEGDDPDSEYTPHPSHYDYLQEQVGS